METTDQMPVAVPPSGFTHDRADLESMPAEQLEREIGELAAQIHAATCRWLLLVAEYDRRETWKEWGCKSCADWLSLRCALAPGPAREHVRVARRLEDLPLVRASFLRGELSYSKVRAITRVADHTGEAYLLGLAQHATAAQLERLVRAYRGVIATQIEETNRAYDQRYLSWEWDDDGSLLIRGRLPAEDGALLLRALEAARDRLRDVPAETSTAEYADVPAETPSANSADVPAETPTADLADVPAGTPSPLDRTHPTNADALTLMAETLLSNGLAQRSACERYQVVVHVDADTLRDGAPGRCELDDGTQLPAETARRLACDASIVPMTVRNGTPLTVGRKTRSIPPALRRALRARDRGCSFPGCTQRRFVDAHHVHHWARGGETKLSNLVLLCRHHHRLIHEGGFRVERPQGRMPPIFRRPDGRPIPRVPRRARKVVSSPPSSLLPSAAAIGPETCAARSAGGPMSYDMAVDGLLASAGLLGPVGDVSAGTFDYGSTAPKCDERQRAVVD